MVERTTIRPEITRPDREGSRRPWQRSVLDPAPRVHEAGLEGEDDGLGPVAEIERGQQRVHMGRDRRVPDDQRVGTIAA